MLMGNCVTGELGEYLVITGKSLAELDRILLEKGRRLGSQPRIFASGRILAGAGAVHYKRAEEILDRSDVGRRLSRPVHCLVKCPSDRRRNRVLVGHCWSAEAPHDALVWIAPGLYACAPEFGFLQASRFLSPACCALFGTELIGDYLRDDTSEYGCRNAPVATSFDSLSRFLEGARGKSGFRKARLALRFLLARSRSPQESRCMLVFSLPRRLGGFGLPQPQLNARIETNPEYEETGCSEPRYCDIYFPELKLDIEYNGSQHEWGDAPIRDLERERALFRVGVTVVSLTVSALENPMEMERLARAIERRLGRSPKSDSDEVRARRKELFAQFFPWKREAYESGMVATA